MEGSDGHYEFTPAQNTVLGKSATWIGLFAWIMIGSSAIMAIGGFLSIDEGSIGALIAAGVYFAIGMNFRSSSTSMKAVVQTEGNDIDHLMAALDSLGSAFKFMGILFLVGVLLVAGALVIFGAMYGVAAP